MKPTLEDAKKALQHNPNFEAMRLFIRKRCKTLVEQRKIEGLEEVMKLYQALTGESIFDRPD